MQTDWLYSWGTANFRSCDTAAVYLQCCLVLRLIGIDDLKKENTKFKQGREAK